MAAHLSILIQTCTHHSNSSSNSSFLIRSDAMNRASSNTCGSGRANGGVEVRAEIFAASSAIPTALMTLTTPIAPMKTDFPKRRRRSNLSCKERKVVVRDVYGRKALVHPHSSKLNYFTSVTDASMQTATLKFMLMVKVYKIAMSVYSVVTVQKIAK